MRDLINIVEQEETGVQFREHRGSLTDSMETLQTFKTKADLVRYLQGAVNPEIEASDLEIEEYAGPDPRIGWLMTYIVLLDGMPIGFTDKLFPETIHETAPAMWQPFSIPVTITLNLITNASSQEEAQRFVQQSLSGIEIDPGFGNGEQLKIDGGINAVIDHSSALRENAGLPGRDELADMIEVLPHHADLSGPPVPRPNAYVYVNPRGNVVIFPEGGGALDCKPLSGDIGPFAG